MLTPANGPSAFASSSLCASYDIASWEHATNYHASDDWLAEGFVHLSQLEQAVTLAPLSTAATDVISTRAASLRKLWTRHNALLNITCPFLRIPREIQGRILTEVAMGKPVWEWIGLELICSSLRSVLLGLHSLWGDAIKHSGDNVRQCEELLERAGPSAPLSLNIGSINLKDPPKILQLALGHLNRARHIYATHSAFIQPFIQNAGPAALPFLERLCLRLFDKPFTDVTAVEPLLRVTPRLRSVDLQDVMWNFRAPNLTSLQIVRHEAATVYTPSQLCDLLQQSQHLQWLNVECYLPYISDEMISNTTIFLPHLVTLFVKDRRDCAIQFWRLLSVPLEAGISFKLLCDEDTHHAEPSYSGPPLFQDVAVFKSHFEGRHFKMLEATGGSGYGPSFHFSDAVENLRHRGPGFILEYLLVSEPGDITRDVRDLGIRGLRAMHQNLSLFSITRLLLGACEGDVEHWTTILSGLPLVEYLLVGRLSSSFCAALGSVSTHISSNIDVSPSQLLLLPQLGELTLRSAEWRTQSRGPAYQLETTAFLDMMQARRAQGRPLRVLNFHNLTIDDVQEGLGLSSFEITLYTDYPDCTVNILP